MKPSELISLRNQLLRVNTTTAKDSLLAPHHTLSILLAAYPDDEDCKWIDQLFGKTNHNLTLIDSVLDKRIEEIEEEICEQSVKFIMEDNKHWTQHNVRFKTAEYNREFQKLPITNEAAASVRSRIGFYTDWRFAGLEIGPGDGAWTQDLVACDPLYLIDYNDECLTTTKNQFSEKYRNRLRCYTNRGEGLHMLPQDQFGFVFSWNTFNYFSFNQIGDYLKEIWKVLRPGGGCMFSYNNAERPLCAQRAEDHLMSYIPKSILVDMIEGYGFEQIKTQDVDSTISWVEFRKPGDLMSQRTGQTLGKIILTPHVEA